MQKVDESNLGSVVQDFINSTKASLEWKWDNRFKTALAEFTVADQEAIMGLFSGYFGPPWDTNNIIGASPQVKNIDYSFGSLMYGQQLLTSDPAGGIILYCMWWPWGNGEQVSVRVGFYKDGEDDAEKEKSAQQLRTLFGLE